MGVDIDHFENHWFRQTSATFFYCYLGGYVPVVQWKDNEVVVTSSNHVNIATILIVRRYIYIQQEMKKINVIRPFHFISITREWEVWIYSKYLTDLLLNIDQQFKSGTGPCF